MNARLSATLMIAAATCVLTAPAAAQAAHPDSRLTPVYVAHLHSMNTKLTGLQTMGEARFTIKGDSLTISVKAKGAPPGITHWQHFPRIQGQSRCKLPDPSS